MQYYRNIFSGLTQTAPLTLHVDEARGSVRFEAEYPIPKGWDRSRDGPKVRTLSVRPDDLLGEVPAFDGSTRSRHYPITHPVRTRQVLKVVLGSDRALGKDRNRISKPAFEYAMDQDFRYGTLTKEFTFTTKSDRIAPEDFATSMASLAGI